MKQMKRKPLILISVFYLLVFCSCSQQYKDEEIKKDLTSKAKKEKNFAGVRFVVDNGVVTLSGECPTEKVRNEVQSKVEKVYAVKEVINHMTVAPVIIGTDQKLKQGIDSVLSKYPGVLAIVKDSMVQLQGKAQAKDQDKLLSAIQKLGPRQLQNEVVFR
jgi:osmotically-inducible protein OsmY